MRKVEIKGTGEDTVDITGLGKKDIEVYFNDPGEGQHVVFSDGTIVHMYNDSDDVWRFDVKEEGTSYVTHVKYDNEAEAEDEDDDGDSWLKSDRMSLEGDIRWLVTGDYQEP